MTHLYAWFLPSSSLSSSHFLVPSLSCERYSNCTTNEFGFLIWNLNSRSSSWFQGSKNSSEHYRTALWTANEEPHTHGRGPVTRNTVTVDLGTGLWAFTSRVSCLSLGLFLTSFFSVVADSQGTTKQEWFMTILSPVLQVDQHHSLTLISLQVSNKDPSSPHLRASTHVARTWPSVSDRCEFES